MSKLEKAEKSESAEHEKYEVENAVRVLLEAEEIKADKKLMAAVGPLLEKKKKALDGISSIADLRSVAKKKAKEEL